MTGSQTGRAKRYFRRLAIAAGPTLFYFALYYMLAINHIAKPVASMTGEISVMEQYVILAFGLATISVIAAAISAAVFVNKRIPLVVGSQLLAGLITYTLMRIS